MIARLIIIILSIFLFSSQCVFASNSLKKEKLRIEKNINLVRNKESIVVDDINFIFGKKTTSSLDFTTQDGFINIKAEYIPFLAANPKISASGADVKIINIRSTEVPILTGEGGGIGYSISCKFQLSPLSSTNGTFYSAKIDFPSINDIAQKIGAHSPIEILPGFTITGRVFDSDADLEEYIKQNMKLVARKNMNWFELTLDNIMNHIETAHTLEAIGILVLSFILTIGSVFIWYRIFVVAADEFYIYSLVYLGVAVIPLGVVIKCGQRLIALWF